MNKGIYLGIMVCPIKELFHEKGYYQRLQLLGKENKINVFVFYPDRVDFKKELVSGYQYDFKTNSWVNTWFPLPNYVYDRCFYTSSKKYLYYKPFVKQIRENKKIEFLGLGLKGKWDVYKILLNDPKFTKYLPKTEMFTSTNQLKQWLEQSPIILKPMGGSHGSGVIKIFKKKSFFEVLGRNHFNIKINHTFNNFEELSNWVKAFTKGTRFIIQKFLDLNTSKNQPYDIRVLVQKNQYGQWELTGMAARVGAINNITSNLHGGGKVEAVNVILGKEFNREKAESIIDEINMIATTIPPILEKSHGNLFEIGLDIGVDRNGDIWIIEVNSKPGRRAFTLLNDKAKIAKSISQPIYFTKYLASLNNNNF